MRQDYVLWKRKWTLPPAKGSGRAKPRERIVYYVIYWQGDKRVYRSTGKAKKWEAEREAGKLLGRGKKDDVRLGEYLEPFFDYERYPHIRRVLNDGKSYSRRFANDQRARVRLYILSDPIAARPHLGRHRRLEGPAPQERCRGPDD